MLCSRCHQKITPGEEVQKTSLFWFWGSETCCKKCAVIRDRQKWYYILFVAAIAVVPWLIYLIILLVKGF